MPDDSAGVYRQGQPGPGGCAGLGVDGFDDRAGADMAQATDADVRVSREILAFGEDIFEQMKSGRGQQIREKRESVFPPELR